MRARYLIAFTMMLIVSGNSYSYSKDGDCSESDGLCWKERCYNGTCWFAGPADMWIMPPVRYDYEFPGMLIETRATTLQDMASFCAPHPRAMYVFGCAQLYYTYENKPRCNIYIAPDWYLKQNGRSREAVWRHERAHCNAWPADHPQ